ncbi:MAG TPA: DUF1016 N-terminal domain-containing protein [Chitinophagaceae bacterium]|jgi:predicted nuclease of restriction endonuclease-like (RecB) superfamily|nr:DUF1016 N-terminal domain-containing protein [Chitinophagaceae bacterium]
METKTENRETSTGDRLAVDLSEIIEKKHREFLRAINSGLVTLFWEIGKGLNQYVCKNKRPEYDKSVIRTISTQLVANYGPWFTEKNLKKMGQFADQFPEFSSVAQISPLVSWEHILLLIQIKDLELKLFYFKLTVEQGLTVNRLRKRMSANLFKQLKAFKAGKDRIGVLTESLKTGKFLQLLQPGLQQTSRNNPVIKNVFKEPLLSSFRKLMEPSKKKSTMLVEKNKKIPAIEKELFGVLSQHIEKYRCRKNRWLNANLNLSFWEIGKRINQEILLTNESIHRESIIRNVSLQLEKKYSQIFSKKQLHEMAEFAEQFNDLNIALRIAYLVSWEHILALLSLREIEAKLFYARLTATQGLNIAGLRKQIAKHIYEQTRRAREREQATMVALQNSLKTSIKKTKGSTVTIDTIFIDDINNNLVITNIFKNPYLPLLLLSAKKI